MAPPASPSSSVLPPEATLARCVLSVAASGGMPDSFWSSDSRIVAACATLGWTPARALEWAEGHDGWVPGDPD